MTYVKWLYITLSHTSFLHITTHYVDRHTQHALTYTLSINLIMYLTYTPHMILTYTPHMILTYTPHMILTIHTTRMHKHHRYSYTPHVLAYTPHVIAYTPHLLAYTPHVCIHTAHNILTYTTHIIFADMVRHNQQYQLNFQGEIFCFRQRGSARDNVKETQFPNRKLCRD